jgi:DivIVA domain-containing protein
MPLTPADVHNVAFSKPPIGKRGYNEDEVDAFLDLVEAELARLIEENDDLREQVGQLEQRLGNAQADLEEARSRPPAGLGPVPSTQQLQRQVEPPPPPMPPRGMEPMRGMGPGPEPDYRGGGDTGGDHHVQAAKVLGLAQEMADRLTAEAKSEADTMLSDARNKSEQLLSDARAKSDGLVNDARSRAETMLNDARTRAETLERQSRDKAAQVLEKKIDELRTFEREYRTRLKTYLESQLRDLEGRGTAAPTESRATANGGYAASGYGQRADAGS